MSKTATDNARQTTAPKPFLTDVKVLRQRAREHITGADVLGSPSHPAASARSTTA